MLLAKAHVKKVKSLFTNLDADDSGYISLKELEENIDKKSATRAQTDGAP